MQDKESNLLTPFPTKDTQTKTNQVFFSISSMQRMLITRVDLSHQIYLFDIFIIDLYIANEGLRQWPDIDYS